MLDITLKTEFLSAAGKATKEPAIVTYDNVTKGEMAEVEGLLVGVLADLAERAKDLAGGRVPKIANTDSPVTLQFTFSATEDGKEWATQVNRWPGLGEAHVALLTGMLDGALQRTSPKLKGKFKQGKSKK